MSYPAAPLADSLDDKDKLLLIQELIQKLEYRISENKLFEHIGSVRSHWRERLL